MSVSAHPRVPDDSEVQRLRILNQLLAALSQASELPDVYEAALTSLLEATAADRAEILLIDDDDVLRCKASRGVSGEFAQPIVVVPLALNTGVIGQFMLYSDEPHECSSNELEMAQAIATHVALATRHKRAEGARALSEQRLQGILDNLASVIFLKDPQGRYLLVNRCFEQLFHVKRTEVLGRTDWDIFPADIADRFQASDRAVLAAGQPLEIEEDMRHGEGGMHSYSSLKFPLKGPDGSVAGVGGISTDITEHKQLEAASRHLAAIVESSDDAIIGKDLHGIITSWNKAAERTFGYTAEEAIGQPVSMLAPPDHIDEMPAILSKIKQGQPVQHYETRRQSRDGHIIDVSLTVSPVRDAAGRIMGASKIARDISNRKQAEQERARLLSGEQEARRTAELLNRVGPQLAAQLDLQKLVQQVTDSATALVGAEMGAFFHNVTNEKGESYMLYTLSGVPREAFAEFPMPGNTGLFGPTFRGESVVRCDDVTQDLRYGKNAPHYGMPKGHMPVRSYLAAPVIARSERCWADCSLVIPWQASSRRITARSLPELPRRLPLRSTMHACSSRPSGFRQNSSDPMRSCGARIGIWRSLPTPQATICRSRCGPSLFQLS